MITPDNADIILHVRLYFLAFSGVPNYDSRTTQDEIIELFASVNALWSCARIRWKLLSSQQVVIQPKEATAFVSASKKSELRRILGQISPVLPLVLQKRIWKICLLSHMPLPTGGVYVPETKTVFFAESSRHKSPNAVTLAHELGHMLGLHHVEYDTNFMNIGSLREMQTMIHLGLGVPSKPLTEEQITNARLQAKQLPY